MKNARQRSSNVKKNQIQSISFKYKAGLQNGLQTETTQSVSLLRALMQFKKVSNLIENRCA